MTKTVVLIGTASYVSPEQATGQPTDARADIYSLGTVLDHCITNDVPFTGDLLATKRQTEVDLAAATPMRTFFPKKPPPATNN